MILLDTSYVSPLLINTLSQTEKPIYDVTHQQFLKGDFAFRAFGQDHSIIMNAEIGVNTLNEFLPDHNLTKMANLFKNKLAFRKSLASKYPDFFFQSCSLKELKQLRVSELPYPIIVKPIFGYGSEGVNKINNSQAMTNYINTLAENRIVDERFILEQYIEGNEYAIDCYYNEHGEAVILNVFTRSFKDSNDVGDRIYFTSKEVIRSTIPMFTQYIQHFGENYRLKNIPIHIELRVTPSNDIIPIEINPLRFAGEGTTELGYYAYQINPYDYYIHNQKPDWDKVIAEMDDAIYSFTCAEIEKEMEPSIIDVIDHDALKKEFNEILSYRVLPLIGRSTFAVIFFKSPNVQEHGHILHLDFQQFIKCKHYQLQ
ncbi:ATP-grasp domain-containing protein [Lysinibacillus sp. 54212]|uniref:ATP-grasp domain-containing protein n=1 Tax=Lysinibacillus sp. 54212 TaxID=3119829 RepID=UPI002FCA3F25